MPWVKTNREGKAVDFYIELLDDDSREALIEDLESGKTIYLPENTQDIKKINKSDFDLETYKDLIHFLSKYRGKKIKSKGQYWYDSESQRYRRR